MHQAFDIGYLMEGGNEVGKCYRGKNFLNIKNIYEITLLNKCTYVSLCVEPWEER